MTKERYNESIKPFIVLVGICVVVAALLALTNSVTAPVIERNKAAAAEATRSAVLPGSESFTQLELPEGAEVDSIFADDGGAGYVITATRSGYHGDVAVTVGINALGEIVGVSADVSTETKGIGSKAGDKEYTDKYVGLSGSADGVDTLSGATYSSLAIKKAVGAALDAYDAVKGDK